MNTQPNKRDKNFAERPRRLRHTQAIRDLVRENSLSKNDFIYPLFITHGTNKKNEIESMPGQFQFSVDRLADEVAEIQRLGIKALLLFGIPETKDAVGKENFSTDGIIQNATREIKRLAPDILVITDVCMCEYTDHGHCGFINESDSKIFQPELPEGYVLNDETLEIYNRAAISHAEAGADIIAPSGMMDGQVASLREALDENNFSHIPIMAYAVKYASAFYGPFRDAADGAPQFGDRKTHQMDIANRRDAIREARLDVEQGADFLMIKPALSYLDIIAEVRGAFVELPIVAYNVSGEYAMIKAAAEKGWLDEKRVVQETLLSMKRAGADLIVTYFAKDICKWLNQR